MANWIYDAIFIVEVLLNITIKSLLIIVIYIFIIGRLRFKLNK